MYFKEQAIHGIPALKLCRSPCAWQMTKILFLQITLSHLCFLVQYKPFPSHQHCVMVFRVLCSLRACHNCPVSRHMHTPMECLCMCAKLCIFCATIEHKLYAIVLHLQAIFHYHYFFFYIQLFMQIEALFPRRFGTWSEYAKKYCNARVRYYCTCSFIFQ